MASTSDPDPFKPVKNAEPAVRELVKEVLTLEKERLNQKKAHLVDDITALIKRAVR